MIIYVNALKIHGDLFIFFPFKGSGDSRSGLWRSPFWGSRDAEFFGDPSDNAWLFSMGDDEDVAGWEFSGSTHEFLSWFMTQFLLVLVELDYTKKQKNWYQ